MAHLTISLGIIGSGDPVSAEIEQLAYNVGAHIARNNAHLICGGLGGVMEASSHGAYDNKGIVVAILPGNAKADANPYATVIIPTGMGHARNALVVKSSDALIALPGSYGTLSEIALALAMGKTVIALPGAWELGKIAPVDTRLFKQAFEPGQAVGLALDAAVKKDTLV